MLLSGTRCVCGKLRLLSIRCNLGCCEHHCMSLQTLPVLWLQPRSGGLFPKMLPAVSTCSLAAFARMTRTRQGSLNRLSTMFLGTLSHFIISPLIGSGDINSHTYPSGNWFTCFTYKVNAASGGPKRGVVLPFPWKPLEQQHKLTTVTADFCLVLICFVCFDCFHQAALLV